MLQFVLFFLLCLLLLLPSSSGGPFPAAWPASLQGSPCSRVLHRCWCGRWQQQCCPVVAGPQEGQRVQRRGQIAALIQDFTVEQTLPLPGAAWASGHSLGNSEPEGAALGSAAAMQGEQSQDPGVLTLQLYPCLRCLLGWEVTREPARALPWASSPSLSP